MKNGKNILVVADPLGRLKPKGDTSLALTHAAQQQGFEVYWATERDVRYSDNRIRVRASRCSAFELDNLPDISKPVEFQAQDFAAIWVRKDPPFDENYIKLCWLLALVEPYTWMMNKPSLLVRYHEKILQLEAHAEGYLRDDDLIQTHIGSWESAKREIREKKWEKVVTKPFLGHAGSEVARWNAEALLAADPPKDSEDLVTQPYLSSVTERGDRRVFFLRGEVLAHFVRMPKAGDFISNLAYGGSAILAPLTEKEREILPRLGAFLKKKGVFFAGADVLDSRISEVNITSPTGIRMQSSLENKDYAKMMINVMKEELSSFRPLSRDGG